MGFQIHPDEAYATPQKRCGSGKSKGKVPKRIHKAEREKLKREQLNDLFLQLGSAVEITQPNNGKASILCEATRLLKDTLVQLERLKKENESLLSESNYVLAEKNELKEENAALESEIERLHKELDDRVAKTTPDLNVPPLEFQQPALSSHVPGEPFVLPAADNTLQQPPALIVLPFHPDLQPYKMTSTNVSKPHARYPTAADSWPSKLLEEQLTVRKEVQ
ncbi:basic helix-loop-helix (bHLH) DNA-binding superfamily protein [Euphorbia peplus]|nr:basic helix-loop-helix (bHLH) DNA-binding superfamily protein [Euphorbia peplus]